MTTTTMTAVKVTKEQGEWTKVTLADLEEAPETLAELYPQKGEVRITVRAEEEKVKTGDRFEVTIRKL